jgi:hypothetical protein
MTEPQDPYQGQPYGGYAGYPSYPAYPAYPSYPGYPPYAGQPVPPGYPAYPPPPGYPPYGYPYGYPPPYVAPGSKRPGTTTAAAVLAFVTAGLLILAALALLAGASTINSLSTDQPFFEHGNVTGELYVDALINLFTGGLLLFGGLQLAGRKHTGLQLMCVGAGITVACSIYWLVRPSDVAPAIFWSLMFGALAVTMACLALAPAGRTWLEAKLSAPG